MRTWRGPKCVVESFNRYLGTYHGRMEIKVEKRDNDLSYLVMSGSDQVYELYHAFEKGHVAGSAAGFEAARTELRR